MNTKLYVILMIVLLLFSGCAIDKVGRAVGVEEEINEEPEEVEEEVEEEEVVEEEVEEVEEEVIDEEPIEEVVVDEVEEIIEAEEQIDTVSDEIEVLETVEEVVVEAEEIVEEEVEVVVEDTEESTPEVAPKRINKKNQRTLELYNKGREEASSEAASEKSVVEESVLETPAIVEASGTLSDAEIDALFAADESAPVVESSGPETDALGFELDSEVVVPDQRGVHVHVETMRESYQLGKEGDFDNIQRQIVVMITDPPPKQSFGAKVASWFRGLVGFAVRGSVEGTEGVTPFEDRSQIVNYFMKPLTVFPYMRLKDLTAGETVEVYLNGKEPIEIAPARVSENGQFEPGVVKLDEFWMNKGGFNPEYEGLYEVYVDVRNENGQIMLDPSGVPLLSSYTFSVDACEPALCKEIGASCGVAEDSCGGKILCGRCDEGEVCSENRCLQEDAAELCEPKECSQNVCGIVDDGCGGSVACGRCDDGFACSEENKCLDLEQTCKTDAGCEPGRYCDTGNGFCVLSTICSSDDECATGEVCDPDRFTCVEGEGDIAPSFTREVVDEVEIIAEASGVCPNADFTNYCCALSDRQMDIFRTLFKEGFIPVDDITFIGYELNFKEGASLC